MLSASRKAGTYKEGDTLLDGWETAIKTDVEWLDKLRASQVDSHKHASEVFQKNVSQDSFDTLQCRRQRIQAQRLELEVDVRQW